MSERQEKKDRVMKQLQHRAQLLIWIGEMPNPWKPWEVIKWRRRMPQLQRRD